MISHPMAAAPISHAEGRHRATDLYVTGHTRGPPCLMSRQTRTKGRPSHLVLPHPDKGAATKNV
jgi:hypothetical protein